MKLAPALLGSVTAAVALSASPGALARTITIELTNMTHGMYFTPRLAAAHGSDYHLFEVGTAASPGIRTMAETGNPMGAAGEVPASAVFTVDASGNSPTEAEGVPRILAPGGSASIVIENVPDENVLLSLGAMLMPTNDAFVGLDSWSVPAGTGTTTLFLNAYDAGTEANTELVLPEALRAVPECSGNEDESNADCNGTSYVPFHPDASRSGVFNVGAGGAGVVASSSVETAVVHVHRNVIGDLDGAAGSSDLDATFHRWLNPVGRAVVTVSE